jgi:hypothetical protein
LTTTGTITWAETPTASVQFRVTEKTPASLYVWLGLSPDPTDPSPNIQMAENGATPPDADSLNRIGVAASAEPGWIVTEGRSTTVTLRDAWVDPPPESFAQAVTRKLPGDE